MVLDTPKVNLAYFNTLSVVPAFTNQKTNKIPSKGRFLPWFREVNNHGDRFRPLRIGLWDPFQIGRTTYVRPGVILQGAMVSLKWLTKWLWCCWGCWARCRLFEKEQGTNRPLPGFPKVNPHLPVPYICGTKLPVANILGNWTPGSKISKYIGNWKMREKYKRISFINKWFKVEGWGMFQGYVGVFLDLCLG